MPGNSCGKRILVIKLGALGDVALATPLLARILEAHAADEVTLLTAPAFVELLSGFNHLQIVSFQRKGAVEMLRLLRWLLATRL